MTPFERKAAAVRFYLLCAAGLLIAWMHPEFGVALWPILLIPCPDCCPCIVSCSRCLNSEANCEYEVTVAGVTAGSCAAADCTDWNSTFLLGLVSDTGVCTFNVGGISICGATAPNFRINHIGTKRFLQVAAGSGSMDWTFTDVDDTDGTSCLAISQALTALNQDGQCDISASTCQVDSA